MARRIQDGSIVAGPYLTFLGLSDTLDDTRDEASFTDVGYQTWFGHKKGGRYETTGPEFVTSAGRSSANFEKFATNIAASSRALVS